MERRRNVLAPTDVAEDGNPGAVEELAQLVLLRPAFARKGEIRVNHARDRQRPRSQTVRTRLLDLDEARLDEMLFFLDDLGLHLLAGKGSGHEHDASVPQAPDAVAPVYVLSNANCQSHA